MPTYGYECALCDAEFEVLQRITDQPLAIHDGCGGELRRKLYPVGIVFKGPGFHVNDYAPKRNGKETASAKSEVVPDKTESAAPTADTKPTKETTPTPKT